ncbi:LysR family transcriptional regulator [Paracoccus sp. IB05]|uniref:LysR family transcriptional regulator n=1 Tax=Paracoccus sp. IB05 TaxID=2779367 RepID=UPI0018E7A659|nr:LysR family transcriptional regulator [Paracoccus sp. IB05]MBJ2153560.1 LysR family transcriptional regulator [Paracoccus sp. IB05]
MFRLAYSDIRLLRIFHQVVIGRSFAAASTALGVSEAVVSRAMSDLEARTGMMLCQRGRGGFVLEADGEFVMKATQRLLSEMDLFSESIGTYRQGMAGELRLAITESTLSDRNNRISEYITRYKLRAPNVRIELSVLPPSGVQSHVLNGLAHIGFLPTHRRVVDLTYQELHEEKMSLYCSPGHPLFETDCSREDIFSAEVAAPDYLLNGQLGLHADTLRIVNSTNSIEGIAMLVMTGSYLGFLPDHFASKWLEQGQLRELLPEVFSYHIRFCAISRSDRKDSKLVHSFLRELG